MNSKYCQQLMDAQNLITVPPNSVPESASTSFTREKNLSSLTPRRCSNVSTGTRDLWDRIFYEAYKADVCINTRNGGILVAHSNVLGMSSPVLRCMLKQARRSCGQRSISILGVPHDAVRVFIRFLYSSCYEEEEMDELVLPLLVLSHAFVVPHLKRECEEKLEMSLLTIDNVVDVFQLALLCDAPRLTLICYRIISNNLKPVSESQGWKAMKQSHPFLETELLEHMTIDQKIKKMRKRKSEERKIYLELYEAMEALVHICKDGCRTIGPYDQDLKANEAPCGYAACKGIELLIRHFVACKLRVPRGCPHCKRMLQLFELHSRLCADSHICKVPLCRSFKQKLFCQRKKDEKKWKILVHKILRAKGIAVAPIFKQQ